MQKVWQKIKTLPIIKKLNKFEFMPIIWWTLLLSIFPYILSLCHIPIIWRMIFIFISTNCVVSYYLGSFIRKHSLPIYWIFLLPIVFDLAIFVHFANYNLFLGLVYLIFELFGLMGKDLYR